MHVVNAHSDLKVSYVRQIQMIVQMFRARTAGFVSTVWQSLVVVVQLASRVISVKLMSTIVRVHRAKTVVDAPMPPVRINVNVLMVTRGSAVKLRPMSVRM